MSDEKLVRSSQDLSIDSQSRVYNKQLFMQTLSQLSTFQDLSQSNCFKKATKKSKSDIVEILKDQKASTVEALDISNLELATLEDQPEFDDLMALEMLNASNNLFMNISDFLRFNSLVYLDLSSNQITSLYCIDMIPNLKTLILANNKLDDIGSLTGCNKLKTLDISNNKLGQLFDTLNNLKQLKKLKKLDVTGNPFCLSYLYKHETLLQLRSLECLNGEKITEADFEVSEKLKQKYFEVEHNTETNAFAGKGRFSKKLRNLAESTKDDDIDGMEDGIARVAGFQAKDQKIELLKNELIEKDERIKYLEGELTIEKSIVKAYECFKLENQELKAKLETLTSALDQSDCKSLACKEKILLLTTTSNMYIDEMRELRKQSNGIGLPQSRSLMIETSIADKKHKDFENKKSRKIPTSAQILSKHPSEESNHLYKPNSANDADDITDNDLEEFLKSTLSKLDEAKSLLKDVHSQQKPKEPLILKGPPILAHKFGQKKNLFAKDKKLVPIPKPL